MVALMPFPRKQVCERACLFLFVWFVSICAGAMTVALDRIHRGYCDHRVQKERAARPSAERRRCHERRNVDAFSLSRGLSYSDCIVLELES